MNKEFKGTKGKWLVNPLRNPMNPEYFCIYIMEGNEPKNIQHIGNVTSQYNDNKEETKYNAELIADAGNTIQSCGLLPSELLKQRDEMRDMIKDFVFEFKNEATSGSQNELLYKAEKLIESTNP